MLCRLRIFQKWLEVDKESEAIQRLYETCGISSRTELNGNKQAQNKFDEMVEDYERWKEESEPF
jgi:hypothetical protein